MRAQAARTTRALPGKEAVESKAALWAAQPVPCAIVEGRMGGSAITVAAINALASGTE